MKFNIEVTTPEDSDPSQVQPIIRAFAAAFKEFRANVQTDVRLWWEDPNVVRAAAIQDDLPVPL